MRKNARRSELKTLDIMTCNKSWRSKSKEKTNVSTIKYAASAKLIDQTTLMANPR